MARIDVPIKVQLVIERDEQRHRRRIACTCGLSRAPIDQGRHAEDCPLGIYDALTHQHAGAVEALELATGTLKRVAEGCVEPAFGAAMCLKAIDHLTAGGQSAALPLPRTDQPKEDR